MRFLIVLLLATAALAQEKASQIPGFDPAAMDRSADPCTDFYQYACGNWMKQNPVPPDQARWGRFDDLQERNFAILRDILEKAAVPDPKRSPNQQKIGDFYASCMDEKAVDAAQARPLAPEMGRIAALRSKAGLLDVVARLHSIGVNAFFRAGSQQDYQDATQVIAVLDQGGLGLPDRDYYVKEDARSAEIRKGYMEHVARMFALAGEKHPQAAAEAVMAIETELAKASLERAARRDPARIYHPMTLADVGKVSRSFPWRQYFALTGAPPVTSVNVRVPDFMKALDQAIAAHPLPHLKTYLRWRLLNDYAPFLSSAFVDENFAFFGKTLTGAQELKPRWKRCVDYVDDHLGEALGQPYVDQTFGTEGKARMLKLVHALEKALGRDIKELPWMTEATKQRALEKLHAIQNKIGYPDRWRDYTALKAVRGDLAGNIMRGARFENRRQLNKIGKPVDKGEWFMSPPTVNAYYSAVQNNINFPAGILQPPFYDNQMDDAVNFGGIGAVIGHELTHGFDDSGRKFDPQGNMKDWWTAEDGKAFEERAQCVADQYSQYEPIPGVKLNGKLTLGENVADNGGLRIAFMALLDTLAERPAPPIDGFTPEQRIFLGWGQIWCQNVTEQESRRRATVDPHSPGRFRVNGTISNMPEFQKAYQCKAGQAMVRQNACRVW